MRSCKAHKATAAHTTLAHLLHRWTLQPIVCARKLAWGDYSVSLRRSRRARQVRLTAGAVQPHCAADARAVSRAGPLGRSLRRNVAPARISQTSGRLKRGGHRQWFARLERSRGCRSNRRRRSTRAVGARPNSIQQTLRQGSTLCLLFTSVSCQLPVCICNLLTGVAQFFEAPTERPVRRRRASPTRAVPTKLAAGKSGRQREKYTKPKHSAAKQRELRPDVALLLPRLTARRRSVVEEGAQAAAARGARRRATR